LRTTLPASDNNRNLNNNGSSVAGIGVLHQVLPDVPESASDTIQGTIRVNVRVNVDSSGNVVEADLTSPGPSR